MAARRLVIVMLVLLGISALAAALVPPPPANDQEQTEGSPSSPPPTPEPGGELVNARIDAGASEPEEIRVQVGDQLALTVRARVADEVEIPDLGLLEFAAPLAPARFDILLPEEASHEIRLIEADRVIGEIVVEPRSATANETGLTEAEAGKQ